MLVISIFSFSHNLFKSPLFQDHLLSGFGILRASGVNCMTPNLVSLDSSRTGFPWLFRMSVLGHYTLKVTANTGDYVNRCRDMKKNVVTGVKHQSIKQLINSWGCCLALAQLILLREGRYTSLISYSLHTGHLQFDRLTLYDVCTYGENIFRSSDLMLTEHYECLSDVTDFNCVQ